jgi:hypothetical protein
MGMLGVYYKDGLYASGEIVDAAFEAEGVSLEWWEPYTQGVASKYFDNSTIIGADIEWVFEGATQPRCRKDGGDHGYEQLAAEGYNCTDGWYYTSACRDSPETCVPVVLAEYDWNVLVWIKAAEEHGLRFAVTWIGANFEFQYAVLTKKKTLVYCGDQMSMCHVKPLRKIFLSEKHPKGRPDTLPNLHKAVWTELESFEPHLFNFVDKIYFDHDDIIGLMMSYAENYKPGNHSVTERVVPDKHVPTLACDWIKSNAEKWQKWIPRTCRPGSAYSDLSSRCETCPPGSASGNGRGCTPCALGTNAFSYGMTSCTTCSPGTFPNSTGCQNCEANTFSAKGTACIACSSDLNEVSAPGSSTCTCGVDHYLNVDRCVPCPGGFSKPELGPQKALCVYIESDTATIFIGAASGFMLVVLGAALALRGTEGGLFSAVQRLLNNGFARGACKVTVGVADIATDALAAVDVLSNPALVAFHTTFATAFGFATVTSFYVIARLLVVIRRKWRDDAAVAPAAAEKGDSSATLAEAARPGVQTALKSDVDDKGKETDIVECIKKAADDAKLGRLTAERAKIDEDTEDSKITLVALCGEDVPMGLVTLWLMLTYIHEISAMLLVSFAFNCLLMGYKMPHVFKLAKSKVRSLNLNIEDNFMSTGDKELGGITEDVRKAAGDIMIEEFEEQKGEVEKRKEKVKEDLLLD